MKENVLMQQASFGLKCSIWMRFFLLYAKGENQCRSRMGMISPELLVKLGQPIVLFPAVLSTWTK